MLDNVIYYLKYGKCAKVLEATGTVLLQWMLHVKDRTIFEFLHR